MTIRIKNTLSAESSANLDDVLIIKKALAKTGHYEVPEYGLTPYPDKQLFKAIKQFQQDENLKIDGIIAPNGETIERLNAGKRKTAARGPTMRCVECGGPHGGSKGDLCPSCDAKQQ